MSNRRPSTYKGKEAKRVKAARELPLVLETIQNPGLARRSCSQSRNLVTYSMWFKLDFILSWLFRIFRAQQFKPSGKNQTRDGIESLSPSRTSSMC